MHSLDIKNLERDFTDDMFREQFAEFGKVCSVVVTKNGLGKSRDFGFVSFELPEHAKKAMEAMNVARYESKTTYAGLVRKKPSEKARLLQTHLQDQEGERNRVRIHGYTTTDYTQRPSPFTAASAMSTPLIADVTLMASLAVSLLISASFDATLATATASLAIGLLITTIAMAVASFAIAVVSIKLKLYDLRSVQN